MTQIPVPAYLAAQSARTSRMLQASDVDGGPLPSPCTAQGVAAYLWPDGRVGFSQDIWRPQPFA